MQLQRFIEQPDSYTLVVGWDSIDDHRHYSVCLRPLAADEIRRSGRAYLGCDQYDWVQPKAVLISLITF
jgi:hypothetical protein